MSHTDVDSELNLPQIDSEVAEGLAEDLANIQADLAAGKINTIQFQELAEGQYPGEIVDGFIQNSKTKEGEAQFPNLVFRIKSSVGTFSIYRPVSSGKPKFRKFLNNWILTTFARLLGPSMQEVEPVDVLEMKPSEVLAAQCNYYSKLAGMTKGKKVVVGIKRDDGGYNQAVIQPSVK